MDGVPPPAIATASITPTNASNDRSEVDVGAYNCEIGMAGQGPPYNLVLIDATAPLPAINPLAKQAVSR